MSFKFCHASGKALLTLFAIYSCPSFAAVLSSEQILQMLKEQDPVIVVKKLHKENHGESWRNTIAQIKAGDPDWLRLPRELEKGTGTKGAEQLMDAVTRAIPENPSGILHILSEKNIYLNEVNICGFPLIPADPATDEAVKTNAIGAIEAQPDGSQCAKIMRRAISGPRTVPGATH
jgi:hypothetical protein